MISLQTRRFRPEWTPLEARVCPTTQVFDFGPGDFFPATTDGFAVVMLTEPLLGYERFDVKIEAFRGPEESLAFDLLTVASVYPGSSPLGTEIVDLLSPSVGEFFTTRERTYDLLELSNVSDLAKPFVMRVGTRIAARALDLA